MVPVDTAPDSDERIVGRFLIGYHGIWHRHFPGLLKRAHWHVIFAASGGGPGGVSCRALHRTLYGAYGTDIRTCVERIKDCASDGFVHTLDAAGTPCPPAPTSVIVATERLESSFDRHCRETVASVHEVFAADAPAASPSDGHFIRDAAAVAAIFGFFGAYDRRWRDAADAVVRSTGLTIAYVDDAMDHLVTYQYWAIVMLLWQRAGEPDAGPIVIDEINSKMWDTLRLGHLAIKERVDNLIRWGFFAEHTVKKHKAVSLTPIADRHLRQCLAQTLPLLRELRDELAADRALAATTA